MDDRDRLLRPLEAVERLAASPRTLEGWRRRGDGPQYVLVGRLPRYRLSDLERWLATRERGAQ